MSQLSVETIFALADREVFKLPPAVVEARARAAAVAALAAEPYPEPEHPAVVAERLTVETAEAAVSGDAVDYDQPRLAREAQERHDARLTALRLAGEQVESRLNSAVRGHGDAIIESLQKPFDKLAGQLREALTLAGQYSDPAAALTASAGVRSKLASRFALRADLNAISAARSVLDRLGHRSERDTQGEFALLKCMDQVYPRASRQMSAPPWGDQDLLEWALTGGHDVWLPTVAEQDKRYDDAYLEAEEHVARNRKHAQAIASSFAYGGGPVYAPPTDRPVRPAPSPRAAAMGERMFGSSADGADRTADAGAADVEPDGS